MAGAIRYRTGIDARTGKVLTGVPHLVQSLEKIWRTRRGNMFMLLDFGHELRELLSEDLTPAIALLVYNEMVASAARWEPEYAITQLQFVSMTEFGSLGIRHAGIYYPEGRYGNYDQAVPLTLAPRRFGRSA